MRACFPTIALFTLLSTAFSPAAVSGGKQPKESCQIIEVRNLSDLSRAFSVPAGCARTALIKAPVSCPTLTIPKHVRLKIVPGGAIDVAAGNTLTIAGKFEAGRNQVFSGRGAVRFARGSTATSYPEWFGAKADGIHDSTAALQSAVDSLTTGSIQFGPGVYRISDSIKLLNKSDITFTGNQSTMRQTNDSKELIHLSGCKNLVLRNLTLYGVLEKAGPHGTENSIRIDPNLPGTSATNNRILLENITFRHNGLNAIYLGGDRTRYGHLSDIRVHNCRMYEGLSFLMAVGVKRLTVDTVDIVHRNIPPVGAGISQDEDIAIISGNGVSCEDVAISNIVIDARGSVENRYTGHAKLDFMIAEAGLTFRNLSVDSVVVKNNLGRFTPTYGTDGSTMYISDRSPDKKGFVNARFSNISFSNSPGIFIEANNLRFDTVSLSGFPRETGWKQYGRAIDSTTRFSTAGCVFINVLIKDWSTSPTIYTAEGGVVFNRLSVRNSSGAVWAASDSVYNDILLDNVSDEEHGALYVSGNSNNIVISNALFRNNRYAALKEQRGNRAQGVVVMNLKYENNTTDADADGQDWKHLNGSAELSNGDRFAVTHRKIGNRHFWIDASGRLRVGTSAPTADADGSLFE